MRKLSWFEKIRDNFIPIEKLYNKFFYTDKVASLLLQIPLSEVNQETSLVFLLQKGFSKYHLLKLFKKQTKLELKVTNAMSQFRVYDPRSKKYIQTVQVKYGQGIEYLLLGEILEKDFKFRFNYTPQQIAEDQGYALCADIEQVLNRIGDYFTDHNKQTLKAIKRLLKEQELAKKLANEE